MTLAKTRNDHLSESRQKLLTKYISGRVSLKLDLHPAISPRPEGVSIPLSFSQQQVWAHSLMAGAVPIYNEPVTIYRHGPMDTAVLERCMVELLRRHEIWRTAFDANDGEPVQIVQPAPERFPLQVIDLRTFDEVEREREARRVGTADAQKPFDLSRAPLVRAVVVRMADEEYRLYITFHQLVVDAVTAYRVFLPELATLYEAFSNGQPSPLPAPALQYGDFAYWQRMSGADNSWTKKESFWRDKLSGELPGLPWPNDHPRSATETFRGAVQRFSFDPQLLTPLRAFCRQEGVSSYMALVAGYVALLNRYTGLDDILLGGLSAGRKRPELEALAGYFVNPFALRVDVSGDPTFRNLTKRVMSVVLDSLANEDFPFQKIVEGLRLKPDHGRNPVFQIIVSQQPLLPAINSGWNLATEEVSNGGAKMDMYMVLDERPDGIAGPITYNRDLFDSETVTRMVGHWQNLLRGGLANPDLRISELPLLSAPERAQILIDWNATATIDSTSVSLPDLIDAQIEKTPESIAVEFEKSRLTYRELNGRADQLAQHLRNAGVGPETLVGLCVERSAEMVVALLAILKTGAAYVPLDPTFPRERLAFMLEDSGMKFLVTQRALKEKLDLNAATTVCIDSEWWQISQQSAVAVGMPSVAADDLAYVLYTSGSTGKPKGVEITHGAIVNFLRSMQREPGITAADSLLAVTTLSFDIAGLEIYLPLITGARVILASHDEAHDPARLQEQMRRSGCTMMQATPAMWRALIHSGWRGSPKLKALCGGEALSRDLVQELLPRCAELWNMYGPTETTVWSTVQRITTADAPVAIGRPIANTTVYVLDQRRNPAPVGVLGELYIGGAGLARGYLGREELTRERFVANPFAPSERLYRTGDWARWLADGTLECRGRADHQVKLRGFRIELGEIEATLGSHSAIRNSAVVVREDAPGEKTLVAYFEPRLTLTPSVHDLRAHLEKTLPTYMIPSAFVAMPKLPLTPNGKLNRNALPAPAETSQYTDQHTNQHADRFAPARDLMEDLLVQLWSKVLNVKRVGIHDNFFELGGHSLLAVRLVLELEKLSNGRLPLATLLNAPTIAQLADVLRSNNWKPQWSSLIPIRPGGSRPPLFLMHSHGGNVLEYYPLANLLDPEWPVYALQARGLDGRLCKDRSLEEMASAYVKELRTLQPSGPYYLVGFCFGGLIALEAAQQLTAAGQEVALVVLIQTMHPRATQFKPELSWAARSWHKLTKRLDLEFAYFSCQGTGYVSDRIRHMWNLLRAHTTIAVDKKTGRDRDPADLPLLYVFEALGIEHRNAMRKYGPRPYAGKTILFRATKQLNGLQSDEFLGWKSVFNGNLEVREVPGHQQTLLMEPNVSRLAQEITNKLRDHLPQSYQPSNHR